MNTTLYREVYRRHHIRKKKYRWYKVDPNATEESRRLDLARMKRQLTMAKNDGYRIVYLDETMFTRKTVADLEWALPGENVQVDLAKLDEPTLAVLSAISKERGQEHYQIFEKSVKINGFKEWMVKLRELNGDDKICLFMD